MRQVYCSASHIHVTQLITRSLLSECMYRQFLFYSNVFTGLKILLCAVHLIRKCLLCTAFLFAICLLFVYVLLLFVFDFSGYKTALNLSVGMNLKVEYMFVAT